MKLLFDVICSNIVSLRWLRGFFLITGKIKTRGGAGHSLQTLLKEADVGVSILREAVSSGLRLKEIIKSSFSSIKNLDGSRCRTMEGMKRRQHSYRVTTKATLPLVPETGK